MDRFGNVCRITDAFLRHLFDHFEAFMWYTDSMSGFRFSLALLFVATFTASPALRAQTLAATPPMGWNSWDSYGLTINEAQFKANATVLAGLRQYGWEYAVIDEGWYMADPTGHTVPEKKYLWNKNGLLMPAA
ncbi:MAG TPA: hypothetical protein VF730_02405, partial [Terracidiphilus sp.]